MFSSKFRLVYNLSHTNILTPRAFGEFDGMPYLVMPYCSRGSCSQLVGRATEPETWKFMRDVARGLAYLHSSNIIHMDIKPENVMIKDDGAYVITDFDIAVNASGTVHLGADRAAGTPAYMAPERFGNGAVPVTASDIWALGASLYELLTGDVPFGDMGGLHQKSGAHVPAIRKSISNELRDIIDRCLQQVTWERPSAQKLADGILPPPWIKKAIITALIVVVAGFGVWYISTLGGGGGTPTGDKPERIEPDVINQLLSDATIAFNNAEYDRSFALFLEVKQHKPNDTTGYTLFVRKAGQIINILGDCDSNVKALLLKAQQLSDTQEVRNLIGNCN